MRGRTRGVACAIPCRNLRRKIARRVRGRLLERGAQPLKDAHREAPRGERRAGGQQARDGEGDGGDGDEEEPEDVDPHLAVHRHQPADERRADDRDGGERGEDDADGVVAHPLRLPLLREEGGEHRVHRVAHEVRQVDAHHHEDLVLGVVAAHQIPTLPAVHHRWRRRRGGGPAALAEVGVRRRWSGLPPTATAVARRRRRRAKKPAAGARSESCGTDATPKAQLAGAQETRTASASSALAAQRPSTSAAA